MADDSVPQHKPEPDGSVQETRLFYANAASLRPGPFDMAIDFGYLAGGEDGPAPPVRWIARVAMSWEHARALHTLIGQQLEQYQQRVGPIPDIEQFRPQEDAS